MAYRVGFQCFDTSEAATDYKMSQVVPHITTDGKLIYPVKQNNQWTYSGQVVELSHGHCDPKEEFLAGLMISTAFSALFLTVFMFKTVKRVIDELFYERGSDDD